MPNESGESLKRRSFDFDANSACRTGHLPENTFFHILGISSSQLTFIFFRGVLSTTNQKRCVFGFWPYTDPRRLAIQFLTSTGPIGLRFRQQKWAPSHRSTNHHGDDVHGIFHDLGQLRTHLEPLFLVSARNFGGHHLVLT